MKITEFQVVGAIEVLALVGILAGSCSNTLNPVDNLCENIDCSGHGSCVVQNGEAACACDQGYVPDGLSCIPEGCTPDCSGKECGPEGCEGTCPPGCGAGEICNEPTGQCEECMPDCDGKDCGPDGCGGTCPPGCGAGEICNDSQCIDTCGNGSIEGYEECDANNLAGRDCAFMGFSAGGTLGCLDDRIFDTSECVGLESRLCEPCYGHGDCLDPGAWCLAYEDSSEPFCATDCSQTGTCPTGYTCYEVYTQDGESVFLCAPTAGDICDQCTPEYCPEPPP